jgi:DHA2 family multidrug resistance protein
MQDNSAPVPMLAGLPLALMTLALSGATFMEVLDITVANVSVPTIAGDLAVSPAQGTWVITGYGVANAITVLLSGWLSRRFGEVRVFTLCALSFGVASFLCGWSSSLEMLVAFRVLQGVVAGPMVSVSQSLLLRNYPPHLRGLAMAVWGMTVVVAPLVGPILGGYITDNYSWQWIFFINVPIAMLAAGVGWNLLRRRETERQAIRLDYAGFALVVIGVGALQTMLDKGKELDWFESPVIIALGVVAAIALVTLIIWELAEESPVVNLRLFQNRNFTVSLIVIAGGYAAMFASIVLLPLFLQTQLGYTATWAGLVIAPVGIFSLTLTPVIGKNLQRLNLRMVVTVSMIAFAAASFWRAGFTTDASAFQLALPQFAQGIAIACFFSPLITQYTANMHPSQFASASSLLNFTRMLAGALATSMVTTVWDQRAAMHQTTLVTHVMPGAPGLDSAAGVLAERGADLVQSTGVLAAAVSQQAYMLAANEIFLWSGFAFLALIIVVWFAKPVHLGGPPGGASR